MNTSGQVKQPGLEFVEWAVKNVLLKTVYDQFDFKNDATNFNTMRPFIVNKINKMFAERTGSFSPKTGVCKWVNPKDRLPEKGGWYVIQYYSGDYDERRWIDEKDWWLKNIQKWLDDPHDVPPPSSAIPKRSLVVSVLEWLAHHSPYRISHNEKPFSTYDEDYNAEHVADHYLRLSFTPPIHQSENKIEGEPEDWEARYCVVNLLLQEMKIYKELAELGAPYLRDMEADNAHDPSVGMHKDEKLTTLVNRLNHQISDDAPRWKNPNQAAPEPEADWDSKKIDRLCEVIAIGEDHIRELQAELSQYKEWHRVAAGGANAACEQVDMLQAELSSLKDRYAMVTAEWTDEKNSLQAEIELLRKSGASLRAGTSILVARMKKTEGRFMEGDIVELIPGLIDVDYYRIHNPPPGNESAKFAYSSVDIIGARCPGLTPYQQEDRLKAAGVAVIAWARIHDDDYSIPTHTVYEVFAASEANKNQTHQP